MRATIFSILVGALVFSNGYHARAQDKLSDSNFYAAYYDGHYGEVADGYWDRHGKHFWYKDRSGVWHQDDGTHFQRESATGYVLVHGSGAARSH
jgi:hypothetical protein